MVDIVDKDVPATNYWRVFQAVILSPLDFAFAWIISTIFFNWWLPVLAKEGDVSNRGVTWKGWVLPAFFRWFQTFDAGLEQGITDGSIPGPAGFKAFRAWLYRNPAYGFSYWFLGIDFKESEWKQVAFQDADPANGVEFYYEARSTSGHFNIHKTLWLFGHHWRLKWGWKAWNNRMIESPSGWNPQPWGPVNRIPFVFSITKA